MNLTQRQVIFGVLFIQGVGALLALIVELFGSRDPLMLLVAAGSLTVISGLTVAYARGWEYTRYLLVLFLTGMIVLTASEQFLRDQVTLAVFIPALVALIVASPLWVVVAALGTYGGLIIRAGGSGAYSDVLGIVIFSMIIAGMILGRLVTDTAQRGLEANAQRAEKALDETRRQAAELTQRAAELVEQNDQQRRLLDLVATLETPAVTLANGVLLAPVVGHLDSRRAQDLTSRLLQDVSALRAQLVVLDIAGVSTMIRKLPRRCSKPRRRYDCLVAG
ncbi:MAG: STAS domain-containing protein [Oscillochloris sp.]|nr:STAS domain-containing protein [Oscillochloris sp.]